MTAGLGETETSVNTYNFNHIRNYVEMLTEKDCVCVLGGSSRWSAVTDCLPTVWKVLGFIPYTCRHMYTHARMHANIHIHTWQGEKDRNSGRGQQRDKDRKWNREPEKNRQKVEEIMERMRKWTRKHFNIKVTYIKLDWNYTQKKSQDDTVKSVLLHRLYVVHSILASEFLSQIINTRGEKHFKVR